MPSAFAAMRSAFCPTSTARCSSAVIRSSMVTIRSAFPYSTLNTRIFSPGYDSYADVIQTDSPVDPQWEDLGISR